MRRLPAIGFALLALATVGAFFLIQSLKTAPPLLWAPLFHIPADFNPVNGRICTSSKGVPINYRETKLTLAIKHADSVGVYIVSASDAGGAPKATISTGTPMPGDPGTANQAIIKKDSRVFTWNGRLADGSLATRGTYFFRVVLSREDRSITLSEYPIRIITQPQHPRILGVRLLGTAAGGGGATASTATTTTTSTAAVTTTTGGGSPTGTQTVALPGPPVLAPVKGTVSSRVKITFSPLAYRHVTIRIYRTDVTGRPQFATSLRVRRLKQNWVIWNGKIGKQPAPAGTYLVTIRAQDPACNPESWPIVLPPAPGTTQGAGVTVRYLSVTPPLTPTVSGSRASVAVDTPNAAYVWRLRRSGTKKILAHGSGPAGRSEIHVRMPRRTAGLYTLTVRAGTQQATVPLVASQAGPVAARARVLVVLPMLTWIGNTPVDDSGDGLPDTLRAGDAVSLDRPLVDGPPAGLGDSATLLNYLSSRHLKYQLTTDVALAQGRGPSLVDRWGVLFPGGEDFLPESLQSTLSGFVKAGGRVAIFGTGVLRGVTRISGFPSDPRASAPLLSAADPFGAQRGPITPTNGELITDLTDALDLFSGTFAFSGFGQYQPIHPPSGATISAAGIADGSPAIIGFHYGTGTAIEVGLPGFAATLAHDIDSQELFANTWHVLAKER